MGDTKIRTEDLRRGDQAAFRAVYDVYYTDMCLYVHHLTRDRQKAEDLVQEVMLSLWKNRKKLNIHTSIRSFLYRCCYNQFIDSYKKIQKESAYMALLRAEALQQIEEEDTELLDKKVKIIQEQVDKLPAKCKSVFHLVKEKGHSYREVATTLDISVKTVEIHMSKAFRKIKAGLKEASYDR